MAVKVLTIEEDILGANSEKARKNQAKLEKHAVLAVNVMASPGAGKTSLILETIRELRGKTRVAVVEGDVASSIDAEKIHREGVLVIQINIPGGCHLDANMFGEALDDLPLEDIDLLLIENVGNLICPAEYALGEHRRVLVSSVPEGDDKPFKYPLMFNEADAVLLNKIDLLPYVKFDTGDFSRAVRGINQKTEVFPLSCTTGEGIEGWTSWLLDQINIR